MNDYILLMHVDTVDLTAEDDWQKYFAALSDLGAFKGGSSIGPGEVVRKTGTPGTLAHHIAGYIIVSAVDLEAAKDLVQGNPVYEKGGSVEVRELPREE